MDETQSSAPDAWLSATIGNAIGVAIDRVTNRPQMIGDPAQAYGVDQNGNIYQLGKTNSQITANVQAATPGAAGISPLLILMVLAVVMLEAK